MTHNFKKATSIFLAILTAVMVCLQPVKVAVRPGRPGISVCSDDDIKEEELPLNPVPLKGN